MERSTNEQSLLNRIIHGAKSSVGLILCACSAAGLAATVNFDVQTTLSQPPVKSIKAETLKIFVTDWQDYSGVDGKGLYFDIVHALFAEESIEPQFIHQPILRGIELLKRGKGDAVLGLWHHRYSIDGKQYLTGGLPLDVEVVSAVFPSNSDWNWQRLRTEQDARYAWVKGYGYDIDLNVPRQAQVPASINGLRMLKHNHIDGFIDDLFYVSKVLQAAPGFEVSDYRLEPILTRNMYLAFQPNADGERWLAIYRKNMEKLLQQGKLHALFKKWGLDYERVKYRDLDRY